ncbi:uncharacterized protein LOC130127530 isoform X2 [Lampris incognitus]|uniref:uncharacterized protein LOC130127530 isoform X2 n=1 Tax=Lampris incognitus TaxID=2546036 RepID=UPI0024B5BB49|nr:uncharacterized protein LOC130127530 isoform X2 [Lampris incognitus]
MPEDDQELQPLTSSCLLARGRTVDPEAWRNSCPIPSTCTAPVVSKYPEEARWKRLCFTKQDSFTHITEDLQMALIWDVVMTDQPDSFMVFCDDHCAVSPWQPGDVYHMEDNRSTNRITGYNINHTSDSSDDLKNSNLSLQEEISTEDANANANLKSLLKPRRDHTVPSQTPSWGLREDGANANANANASLKSLLKPHRDHTVPSQTPSWGLREDDANANANLKSLLKPRRDHTVPSQAPSWGIGEGVKRKSVTFSDEVTLFLFDQVTLTCSHACTIRVHVCTIPGHA